MSNEIESCSGRFLGNYYTDLAARTTTAVRPYTSVRIRRFCRVFAPPARLWGTPWFASAPAVGSRLRVRPQAFQRGFQSPAEESAYPIALLRCNTAGTTTAGRPYTLVCMWRSRHVGSGRRARPCSR
ncbi:MAG: hypothetical protein KDD73_13895, partial [Anaerolineales bacterium]|nr:hypothetical protein [Anaerolineales bacterium]